MHELNLDIFREYDIRGNVEKDFPDHIVIKLGKLLELLSKELEEERLRLVVIFG